MWTLAAARRSTVIKNRWPTRACSGRDFGARLRVYTPSGLHWAADSPWAPKMNTIIILRRPERPADLIRRLIRDGLIPGLVLTLFLVLVQFEASKECRGGAFSAGFGGVASMCTAAISSLQGSAVIADYVFRFRSISGGYASLQWLSRTLSTSRAV